VRQQRAREVLGAAGLEILGVELAEALGGEGLE